MEPLGRKEQLKQEFKAKKKEKVNIEDLKLNFDPSTFEYFKEMNETNLKLYNCTATAIDYDWVEVIMAVSLEEAKEKFSEMVEVSGTWYAGVNVNELKFDGYVISVHKVGEEN